MSAGGAAPIKVQVHRAKATVHRAAGKVTPTLRVIYETRLGAISTFHGFESDRGRGYAAR
jgi:hypothetical protein